MLIKLSLNRDCSEAVICPLNQGNYGFPGPKSDLDLLNNPKCCHLIQKQIDLKSTWNSTESSCITYQNWTSGSCVMHHQILLIMLISISLISQTRYCNRLGTGEVR